MWTGWAVTLFVVGSLPMPCPARGGNAPAAESRDTVSRLDATLFTVEFDRTCGPPVFPGMLSGIVTSSAPKASWRLRTGGPPPLASREAVTYSVVGTSGETSLPTARVFAEIRGGGELSYKSDRGKNVVLQVDVNTVCWDVDQEKALAVARKRGSDHALFAVLRSEDITADVNPDGEFGRQKSFAVSLELVLLDSVSGDVVGSFSEETRVMDLSATGAVRRAAKALVAKGMKALPAGI